MNNVQCYQIEWLKHPGIIIIMSAYQWWEEYRHGQWSQVWPPSPWVLPELVHDEVSAPTRGAGAGQPLGNDRMPSVSHQAEIGLMFIINDNFF